VRAAAQDSFYRTVTATSEHFIVCHMGIPQLNAEEWSLVIGGEVSRPRNLSLAEITSHHRVSLPVTLECAGNPRRPGRPIRRAGNAIWGGTRLRELLADVGVNNSVRYVALQGSDSGVYAGVHSEDYTKYIPIQKAYEDSTIVAYEMNGQTLPKEHGFPLRVVIPGFYGTNSVKWLSEISFLTDAPRGRFSTDLYTEDDGTGGTRPVWHLSVNSRIVGPRKGQQCHAGLHTVWGWAWGSRPVVGVDLSVDEGASWFPATVEARRGYGWQRFEGEWEAVHTGKQCILARATDSDGSTQPMDLAINQVARVTIEVFSLGAGVTDVTGGVGVSGA